MGSDPTLIERRYNCDKRRAKQSADRQSRSLRGKNLKIILATFHILPTRALGLRLYLAMNDADVDNEVIDSVQSLKKT
jgi:hypothetical protein